MFSMLAGWLLKTSFFNTEEAAAKGSRVIVIAGAVLAVLILGKCAIGAIRDDAVSDAEAESRAVAAEAGVEGRKQADALTAEEREAFAREDERTQGNIEDAIENDPEGAAKPVGPATDAFFDSVRGDAEPGPE